MQTFVKLADGNLLNTNQIRKIYIVKEEEQSDYWKVMLELGRDLNDLLWFSMTSPTRQMVEETINRKVAGF